jgi:hypothetical protein
MDYRELREIRRTLRNHAEVIQANKASIYTANTQIHGNEHNVVS